MRLSCRSSRPCRRIPEGIRRAHAFPGFDVPFFDEPITSPVAYFGKSASRVSLGNYTNAFYVGSAICAFAPGSLFLAKLPVVPVSSYIKQDERKLA